MAKFKAELPTELIEKIKELEGNVGIMMEEMTQEGAKVVKKNVLNNMRKSFKTTKVLEGGLRVTRPYKTPSTDGVSTHIGFYGYDRESKPTKRHPKGTPIPLIAMAREFGTSRGEAKKPFFRKSFNKSEIEQAMLDVQDDYIEGD